MDNVGKQLAEIKEFESRKESIFRVCIVAAQGKNNPAVLEEIEEDGQGLQGNLSWDVSEIDESRVEGEEGDGGESVCRKFAVMMIDWLSSLNKLELLRFMRKELYGSRT